MSEKSPPFIYDDRFGCKYIRLDLVAEALAEATETPPYKLAFGGRLRAGGEKTELLMRILAEEAPE